MQVSTVSIPRKMGNGDGVRASFLIDFFFFVNYKNLVHDTSLDMIVYHGEITFGVVSSSQACSISFLALLLTFWDQLINSQAVMHMIWDV